MALLEIEAIDVFYGDLQALKSVTVTLEKSEVVAVLGPNGAGKSTLLRTISGLTRPTSGRVAIDGTVINRMPPHLVADLGVAHVPEGRHIFAGLTVEENLRLGAYRRQARKLREETLRQMYELFPRLRERHDQAAGNLSGGEQQMLAVGRALMQRPALLMLDEPSLGLAPAIVAELYRRLEDIKATGTSLLLVEQHAPQALKLSDRAYLLSTGSVVGSGRPGDLQDQAMIREAYLGI